jgi:hypothetical protein
MGQVPPGQPSLAEVDVVEHEGGDLCDAGGGRG